MSKSFIDSRSARVIALLVVLGCGYVMYALQARYVAQATTPLPQGNQSAEPTDADLNPEFVKCRNERVGQVEKMRSDGVIGDDKFAEFRQRAISTCAGQFPPQG
jgi:hypothetical protein